MENPKKSVVTYCQFTETVELKFGPLHKFDIQFENGDSGVYQSKFKDQTKFEVGKEAQYIVDLKYPQYPKIKPYTENNYSSGGGFKKSKDINEPIQNIIVLQHSTKVAGDFVNAYISQGHKLSLEDIKKKALEIYEWTYSTIENKIEEPKKNDPKDNVIAGTDFDGTTPDDLPF